MHIECFHCQKVMFPIVRMGQWYVNKTWNTFSLLIKSIIYVCTGCSKWILIKVIKMFFMSENFCLYYMAAITMCTLFTFHYVLMEHSVLYVLMFRESRLKVLKKYVFPIQTP